MRTEPAPHLLLQRSDLTDERCCHGYINNSAGFPHSDTVAEQYPLWHWRSQEMF